jgi:uncharacterized membrane protein
MRQRPPHARIFDESTRRFAVSLIGTIIVEEVAMPTSVASISVSRPPEDVWAYLTDWSRYPDWDSLTASAEQVDGDEPRLGTRFRWTGKVAWRRIPFDSEMTEWDPPRRMAYVATSGPGTIRGSSGWTAVTPAGDGCVVEVGVIALPGIGRTVAYISDPLFTWWLGRRRNRDLGRLKSILEGGTAGQPATPQ